MITGVTVTYKISLHYYLRKTGSLNRKSLRFGAKARLGANPSTNDIQLGFKG